MRFYLVLFTVLLPILTKGQSQRIESLTRQAETLKNEQRIDVLNELVFEWFSHDVDKAYSYAQEVIRLSDQIRYEKGKAYGLVYRGIIEYLRGEYAVAREDLQQGLKLANDIKDRSLQGYALLQLGGSYLQSTDLDSALFFYTKSYEALKDSVSPINLSTLYKNLSDYYKLKSDPVAQKKYLLKSLAIREHLSDRSFQIDILIRLVSVYIESGEYAQAELYMAKAEQLLDASTISPEVLHDLHFRKAILLYRQGKYDEAIPLFDSAKNFFFHSKIYEKYAALLTELGLLFEERGEYEVSLNHFYQVLKLSDLYGFEKYKLRSQMEIAWVYYNLKNYPTSLQLSNTVIRLAALKNLEAERSNALNLKGVIYTDQGNYDSADYFLTEALRIRQHLADKIGIAGTLYNQGVLMEQRGKLKEALQLQLQSLSLEQELNHQVGVAWSYYGLVNLYTKLGDKNKSLQYLKLAEQLATELKIAEVLIGVYELKRDYLRNENKYKESLDYALRLDALKDSIRNEKFISRFAGLQQVYELQAKDAEIKLLSRERALQEEELNLQKEKLNQQYILGGLGLLVLLLVSAIAFTYARFYNQIKLLNRQLSEKGEEISAQAEELTESNQTISELNANLQKMVEEKSHDLMVTNQELIKHNTELLQFSYTVSHNLRGPVARLLGLSYLLNRPMADAERSMMLGHMTTATNELDVVLKDLSKIIDIRNELFRVRERVFLEDEWEQCKLILGEQLKEEFDFKIDFSQAPYLFTIKPFIQSILYNLVSNAIKYRSPERKLSVSIKSYLRDNGTVLTVEDNGLGFDSKAHGENIFKLYKRLHVHVEGKGLGLYLVKSQIDSLNGTITIQSGINQGTAFSIYFPVPEAVERQIIFESDTATIYYDATINNTVIIWKKAITSKAYREAFEAVLNTLKNYRTPGWIADLRLQGAVPAEDQVWFIETILTEAVRNGLTRIATIGFKDPIRQDYFNRMQKKVAEFGVTLLIFDELEEAREWMRDLIRK